MYCWMPRTSRGTTRGGGESGRGKKGAKSQGLARGGRGGGKVLELCNKASLIRNPLKISLVRRKIGTSMELVDSGSSQERRDPRMASDQKVSITQGQAAARRGRGESRRGKDVIKSQGQVRG